MIRLGRIVLGLAIVLLPTLVLDVAMQASERVGGVRHKLNHPGWFIDLRRRLGVVASEDRRALRDFPCDALNLPTAIVVTMVA